MSKKLFKENVPAPAVGANAGAAPPPKLTTSGKGVEKALGSSTAAQTAFGKVDSAPKAKEAIMVALNNLSDVTPQDKIKALNLAIVDLKKQLNESFDSVNEFVSYLFE